MVEERTSLTALELELERALVIVDELGETRIGAFIDMALSAVIEHIEGNEQS